LRAQDENEQTKQQREATHGVCHFLYARGAPPPRAAARLATLVPRLRSGRP
jgi:hypothetical protein